MANSNPRISNSLKPHSRASNISNRSRQNGLVHGLAIDGKKRLDTGKTMGDKTSSPRNIYGTTARSFSKP